MRAQLIELTPRELHAVAESVIVEQPFHDRLAIVERALDRERVDVGLASPSSSAAAARRRRGHSGSRMKISARSRPRNASIAAPPVSPDVAPTMVARSLPRLQRVIHQAREQLHRDVLEGERRAVEQLEQIFAIAQLHAAARPPDAERRVGFADHAREIGIGNASAHEGPDHFEARHLRRVFP